MLSRFSKHFSLFALSLTLLLPLTQSAKAAITSFAKDFLWGVAWSEYQNSGAACCPNSTWALWENPKDTTWNKQDQRIKHNQRSGLGTNHWWSYESDIELMKELGVNAARFSVEWAAIQPDGEDSFDETALQHYEDECKALLQAGITPMVTLHHFNDPIWFAARGGFEKEENIPAFVQFCTVVFNRLSPYVQLWCTINEPTIYMLQGYLRGVFPPGKTNPFMATTVLRNLLKAHTDTYIALKSLPGGADAQIGLVHQYLTFEPNHPYNPLEALVTKSLNYFLSSLTINFLKTGLFSPSLTLMTQKYEAPREHLPESKLFDFLGLNYYARVLLTSQLSLKDPLIPIAYPGETMTDMPYGTFPQGLYDALEDLATTGVPLYITENGIADAKDSLRAEFLDRTLAEVQRAVNDGIDVRGYFYWSLMDNFEWDEGYSMKFGLYAVDRKDLTRTLRAGGKHYADLIAGLRRTLPS